jgi:hypothetical protein
MNIPVEINLDRKSVGKPYDMGNWVENQMVLNWGYGSLALEQQ